MDAQAREGPYQFASGIAPRALAMERAGLREQFGRTAHEHILLPKQGCESSLVLQCSECIRG